MFIFVPLFVGMDQVKENTAKEKKIKLNENAMQACHMRKRWNF